MEKPTPIIDFELYLVRHGQSIANISGIDENAPMCDKHDPLLTEVGIEQAEKVGKHLSDIEFDALYSSALRRAAATASKISGYQSKEIPVNILPDLAEIWIPREYPGCSIEELKKEYCPQAVMADGIAPGSPMIASDEDNEEEMFQRAERILNYLSKRYHNGEKIAVVAHAGILTYIIFHIIGYRFMQPRYDFRLSNTGITRIVFYRKGTYIYGDRVFDCVNDTSHLKA